MDEKVGDDAIGKKVIITNFLAFCSCFGRGLRLKTKIKFLNEKIVLLILEVRREKALEWKV